MCFKQKDKWQQFTPTKEYLDTVKHIKTLTELDYFLDRIKYTSDKSDYWQTPEETLNRGKGDCDDYARLALDILVRVQKRKDVRFIIYTGYNKKQKYGAHAVCVFPYNGKYNVFSDIGHIFYPKLKYMEIRNDEGKVISRKFKLWGLL
ncbi:MAG: transglutaminase-like domain-containing protein [Candidatus Heimdallarchaeaceae archaeon]